jgi:hypothetical protein
MASRSYKNQFFDRGQHILQKISVGNKWKHGVRAVAQPPIEYPALLVYRNTIAEKDTQGTFCMCSATVGFIV